MAPWDRSPAVGYLLPDSPGQVLSLTSPATGQGGSILLTRALNQTSLHYLCISWVGMAHTAYLSSCVSSTPAGRLTTSGAYWVLSVASSGCCMSQSCVFSINIDHFCCTFFPIHWSEVKSLSRVRLFATPWTVAYQAPRSMEFSRQEYWSGLPFPSPGYFPNPEIEPRSPELQAGSLPTELLQGKPHTIKCIFSKNFN